MTFTEAISVVSEGIVWLLVGPKVSGGGWAEGRGGDIVRGLEANLLLMHCASLVAIQAAYQKVSSVPPPISTITRPSVLTPSSFLSDSVTSP